MNCQALHLKCQVTYTEIMIDSRKIEDLIPRLQDLARQHIKLCADQGIDIIITSTYRDAETQNALYARGRNGNAGSIVTNARAGESWHNFQRAYDVVPVKFGKAVYNTSGIDGKVWQTLGKIGESLGLEWAGRWVSFKEYPHFQLTDGLTFAQADALMNSGLA